MRQQYQQQTKQIAKTLRKLKTNIKQNLQSGANRGTNRPQKSEKTWEMLERKKNNSLAEVPKLECRKTSIFYKLKHLQFCT